MVSMEMQRQETNPTTEASERNKGGGATGGALL